MILINEPNVYRLITRSNLPSADKLAKNKSAKCPSNTCMAVFDIRNAKLIQPTVKIPHLLSTLKAELAYVLTLLEELG